MCVTYTPSRREELAEIFRSPAPTDATWPDQTWQDYDAPIIRFDEHGNRETIIASYGMIPQNQIHGAGKKFSTMNARSETIGERRSYAKPWREGQLCLVPMTVFYEPNWESGKHVRWGIGMADASPFAVAGLWRESKSPEGETVHTFTQLTINADDHPLMNHFHKPGEEKRSLVIVPATDWDDWLSSRNPEIARSFLRPFPAEAMTAAPVPEKTRSP